MEQGMSKGAFTARLRELLKEVVKEFPHLNLQVGLLSAHSLRRGGAITMAEAGISRELIKLHGRWASDAVDAYLQPSLTTRKSLVERV